MDIQTNFSLFGKFEYQNTEVCMILINHINFVNYICEVSQTYHRPFFIQLMPNHLQAAYIMTTI